MPMVPLLTSRRCCVHSSPYHPRMDGRNPGLRFGVLLRIRAMSIPRRSQQYRGSPSPIDFTDKGSLQLLPIPGLGGNMQARPTSCALVR